MIKKLILFLFLVTGLAVGQLWNGVLAPNRAIDWTQAGAGTIPVRNTICVTTACNTATSAGTSATIAQLNAAIASACGTGTVVKLATGTYNLSDFIYFNNCSTLTLRGSGSNLTFLVFGAGTTIGGIYAANSDTNNSATPHNTATWTGGYSKNTASITLGSVTSGSINNLHVGSLIILDQQDDSSDPGDIYVCDDGTCATGGGGGVVGRPGRGQMQQVTVTSISGTGPYTVGITPGLYAPNWRSGQNPGAWWSNALPATGIGLEDMSIDVSASTAGFNGIVFLHNIAYSWIARMRFVNHTGSGAAKKHVQLYQSSHVTVRDSYFYSGSGSSENYGVDSSFSSSDNLVENNIFQHIATALIHEGDAGSVFGHNYAVDNFYTGSPSGSCPSCQQGDSYDHGVADNYELLEGNIGAETELDNINGTHFMTTLFRLYDSGCDATGTGAGCGGGVKTTQTSAVQIQAINRYMNLVGNILGRSGFHTNLQCVAVSTSGSCASDGTHTVLNIGFSGLDGTHGSLNNDTLTVSSLMRWGNYGVCSGTGCNANRFDTTEDGHSAAVYPGLNPASSTFPPSFYLNFKPAWWGTMPWPAIGPDVLGGPGPGFHTYPNPAQTCYTLMGGLPNGSSGLLAFDPLSCYALATVQQGVIISGVGGCSGICTIGSVGTQLVLTSVTVTPANPIIPFNASQSFSASGTFSDGSTADLTTIATWISSNVTIANNLASCTNPGCATFNCVNRGIVTITATYQSVPGATTLNCQSPTFSPQGIINVPQGGSSITIVQFTGANGTAPFTFSSSDLPGFLSLSNSGCSGSQVNCSLVGTPSTIGVYNFHIQATDNLGNVACTAPGCAVGVNVVASVAEDNTYCDINENVIGQPNDPPAGPITSCNNTAFSNTPLGGSPKTIFVCPIGEKNNTVAIAGCAGAPQPVGNTVPLCNQPGGGTNPYYCSTVQSAFNLVANTTGCGSDIRVYATIDDFLPNSAWNKYMEPTVAPPSPINCGPDFGQPWFYLRTTQFANLTPVGNRISPAFAGVTSINGRPQYTQTSAFGIPAGIYMPMLKAEVRSNGSTFLSSQAGATISGLRMMGVVVAAAHGRDTSVDLYGNGACPLNSAGTAQCSPGGSGGLVLLGCNVVGNTFCGSPGGQHNIMDRVILAGCDDLTMATCYDAMEVHTLFAGGSHLSLIDSYTLHGFCIYLNGPCVDSKSIGGGSSQNGHDDVAVKIVNNYLEASGECIIIGGGANSSGFYPTDWEYRRNHCYKPLTWKADRPEFGTGGIRDTYAAFSNNATAYSGATTCSVDPPVFGGATSTCHPVVIAGSIADVIIDTPGSGYGLQKKGNGTFVKYPNFYFTDGGITYTSCGNQLSGDVNTQDVGGVFTATWVDGDKFKNGLVGTNIITINGVAYSVDLVNSGTKITLHTSAGNQTNVPYSSNFNVRGDCIQPILGIPNVKNLFELKHMKRMLSEGNIGENNWAGQSDQSGLCCLISPKNANNNCPTCTVEDITIRNNFYRNMTSGWQIAISVATQGQTLPAGMKNIAIHDNYMDDMNGPLWTTGTAMIPTNAGLGIQLENANPQAGASSKIKISHNFFLATLPSGFTSTGGSLVNMSGGCQYDKNGTTPALMTYINIEDNFGAGGVRSTSSNSNGCSNCTNNACTYAGHGPTETSLRQLMQNDFELPITGGTSYVNGQLTAIALNNGSVNTNGTNVDLVSGHNFFPAMVGNLININKVDYTVAAYNSPTNITLTTSAPTLTSKIYNLGSYTCSVIPTACTVNGGLAPGGVAATCSLATGTNVISRVFAKDSGQRYASTPTISFNGTCTKIPFATAWVAGIGNPKDSAYCFTHNIMPTAAWNGELGMTPYPTTNGDPVNGVCDGVGHNNTNKLGNPITILSWPDLDMVNYNTDTGTGAECSNVSTACTNSQPPGTGDLHLKSTSNFYQAGTDGLDIGPNADLVIGTSNGATPSPYTGISIDPVNKVLVIPQ